MSFLGDFEVSLTNAFVAGAGNPSPYILSVAASVQGTFKICFIAGFVVWIMMIGYEVAFGKTEDGITYLLTRIGKIFLIGAFAFEGYPMVQDLLIGVQQGFVQAVGNGGSTISSLLDTNIINPLLAYFYSIIDGFKEAFTSFSLASIGTFLTLIGGGIVLLFAYACLWVLSIIICVAAMAMYFAALATFYVFLAVGPFFLLCLCFPFTQKFFESWIGGVMTATLAMAFTALLTGLVASILALNQPATAALFPASPTVAWFGSYGSLPAIVFGKAGLALLCIYLYFKVFDMASSLGGGMNLGSNMIGAMRQMARAANGRGASSSGGGSGGGAVAGPSARAQIASSAGRAGASGIRSVGRGVATIGRGAARVGSDAARLGAYAYNRGVNRVRSLQ